MECVKEMLIVVMDGIKDATMLLDYADNARGKGNEDVHNWFKQKAKLRIDTVKSDWQYVYRATNMMSKIKDGDELAYALNWHINEQISSIEARQMS